MKISYNWLQELIGTGPMPTPEKVEELLTFGAFEVEEAEKVGDDTVFEIKILANRARDALSHRGIAKEVAVLANLSLQHDPFVSVLPEVSPSKELSVEIEDAKLCPRYMGAHIRGVKVGPSPDWLKNRLETLGQRSINNVVDITNYVMLEMGQPLHAFDAAKLSKKGEGYAVGVRAAKKGEKITVLTGEEFELDSGDLLITDAGSDAPIGIAGVKGGKAAEIDTATTDIILESANFSWLSVRKTSRRLRLLTDASKRFEHDLSVHLPNVAMARALELIQKHCGGELVSIADTNPNPPTNSSVMVSKDMFPSLLGHAVDTATIESIFEKLQFSFTQKGEGWEVVAPFERGDITIPQDLVEEVGRVIGYQETPSTELPAPMRAVEINTSFIYEARIREVLTAIGFSEVRTSVFRPKKEGEVELENPIAEDRPRMRRSIAANGLLDALVLNTRNAPLLGTEEIKLFEIGVVFLKDGSEQLNLAIGVEVKKDARKNELLAEAVGALEKEFGTKLTEDGANPKGTKEFNLTATWKQLPLPSEYARIDLSQSFVRYTPVSPYPFSARDIALWTPVGVEASMIRNEIEKSAGPLMVRLDLFDEFKKGDQISFAFHLVFQSSTATLTGEEVAGYMQAVEAAMRAQGWTVR